ncbi:MAG: wax ester/triacylglycerol synthase family O-acyltransferase [Gammaproteobacteria bacterium]|nr:wax ester/triacylglycerol synthase family O-acyltransferase [Gammaproteobacteria bacterium]MDH5228173.1 wax ester/triacylglycerol synthase family O-acyltransferase [Gammaproteobacteria bacterium]
MRQLSGADSMFLQFERGNNFMHVASLGLYDPSTAPGGGVRFKDVLNHFTTRIAQFPQFRRRLVSLPFSLDRPYWVEAGSIDVEFHVRHIALPHPGDWRQLCIQVARLHSRPLDRSKPLWEAYVIEGLQNVDGLPPGSFALYTKMHHSIVDGESGTEIMKALHSMTPDPIDFGAEEASRVYHTDREPTMVELYSRALAHNVQRLPNFARFSIGTARKVAALGAEAVTKFNNLGQGGFVSNVRALLSGDLSTLLPRMPPQTRFSGDVSAHRVFEAVTLPLTGFRDIRKQVPKATINDQFLCVVGGALHAYLSAKNELPDATMVAMVPMSLRGADKGADVGNQVGFTLMPVHSEIEDPLERLRAICEAAQTAKRVTNAVGKELARDLLETLPSIVADPLLRNAKLPRLSLIVSNVRGPDVPLYMAGARLVNYAPISIALDGMGLNVTAFSYAGNMWLCAVSCRDMLPDPSFFAQCMRDAFVKMQEAAAREAAYTVAEAAAIAAPEPDERTIEGRVVHRVARKKAARRPRKAAATASPAKRRVRKTKASVKPAPETPA